MLPFLQPAVAQVLPRKAECDISSMYILHDSMLPRLLSYLCPSHDLTHDPTTARKTKTQQSAL